MTKTKRADKPEATQEWERAVDKFNLETEDELFAQEVEEKPAFNVRFDLISYITSKADADSAAGRLLEKMEKSEKQYFIVGFDIEGTNTPGKFEVLQLYTKVSGRKFALVFKMNKIVKGIKLPAQLERLITYDKCVFVGKGVKKDIKIEINFAKLSSSIKGCL